MGAYNDVLSRAYPSWTKALRGPKAKQPDTRARLLCDCQQLAKALGRELPAGHMEWTEKRYWCEWFELHAEVKCKRDHPESFAAEAARRKAGLGPVPAPKRKAPNLFEDWAR